MIFIFNWRNNFHHASFLSSSNFVFGKIYETKSNFLDYFRLEEINKSLKNDNEQLKKKLFNQQIKVGYFFIEKNDTLFKQQYDLMSSKIINSKYKYRENYLTIKGGSSNGISPNMGVIGSKGLLGIVISSSTYYSTILPIINPNFELAVRHVNSGSFGLLKWTGNDLNWQNAIVEDVPIYIDINKGDLFYTSGSDGIFPEGIIVGKVIDFEKLPNSQFQRILISLVEDFSSVQNAYVINNILKDELLNLEKGTND